MIRVIENPQGIEDDYLACLNICFHDEWTAASYRWYLMRPFESRVPDIITVFENNKLVAGIGINYRQIAMPRGEIINIGVLTAAWVLPEYRGRWHFARLIKASMKIADSKRCIALVSFVMNENSSAACLRRAGAYAFPSQYIFAYKDAPLHMPEEPPVIIEDIDVIKSEYEYSEGDKFNFHYPSQDGWHSQFFNRPNKTTNSRVYDSLAVVEHSDEWDRLQFVSSTQENSVLTLVALAQNSQRRNRNFFTFTCSEFIAKQVNNYGMKTKPGQIMVLNLPIAIRANQNALVQLQNAAWQIQAGDRM